MSTLGERLDSHGLDPLEAYVLGLGALVVGLASGWLAADLLPRWVTVPGVALGVSYVLVMSPPGARLGRYLLAWAALLVAAPVLYLLPEALRADDLGVGLDALLFAESSLLVLVAFWILAVIVGFAGWRVARD